MMGPLFPYASHTLGDSYGSSMGGDHGALGVPSLLHSFLSSLQLAGYTSDEIPQPA